MTPKILEMAADRIELGKALIADPLGWCRELSAVNKWGFFVPAWSDDCVQRCALGSVTAAGHGQQDTIHAEAVSALNHAATVLHDCDSISTPTLTGFVPMPIAHTNDCEDGGHPAVMICMDYAIADLRAQAGKLRGESGPGVWHPAAVWSARQSTQHAAGILNPAPGEE